MGLQNRVGIKEEFPVKSPFPVGPPVTLISVERNPTEDGIGNTFTFNFTKNIPEVTYSASVNNKEIDPGLEVEGSDGVTSISFTCTEDYRPGMYLYVTFQNTSQNSMLSLELEYSPDFAAMEDEFTVPSLDILHSGDLVYRAGRDAKVKVISSYGINGMSDVNYFLDVVTLSEDGRYISTRDEHWISLVERKPYLKNQESLFRISTSRHHASGFFFAAVTFEDARYEALVRKLTVQRAVVLRPSDQAGPYPLDYVTFPDMSRSDSSDNFKTTERCTTGSNCSMRCSAVGSVTDLQVYQLHDESEQWAPVLDAIVSDGDYSRTARWTVSPTEDTPDTKFRCTALGATNNNVSLDLEVTVISQEFFIDGNRSSIHLEEDENQPTADQLVVNCTIVGRPVINAYVMLLFDIYSPSASYLYHIYGQEIPADVIPISPGESVATVTVDYNPTITPYEGFLGVRCVARSIQYRFTEIEIPWSAPSVEGQG
ncbi:hypothetical protein ElyMa_000524400 [Elysia marginata]|uniref:Ig-like domain-containing protein n=1 Tax=Elysia marginata TaxID=1093978 RepID=A0AAV4G093_9GAST|nr:hypothetical protein ElyMa_000524400 [Elysia marginata]